MLDSLIDLSENHQKKTYDFETFFAAHEFARKICDWNLVYVGKYPVPYVCQQFLSETRILAGGAVISTILGRQINDYDIFFVNEIPTEFLNGIRKEYKYYESHNCVTIKFSNWPSVQFIKRVYYSANNVIGGFDLDPCRFFMDKDGHVFCTPNAHKSLEKKIMVINPACQSRSFAARIFKYSFSFKRIQIGKLNPILFSRQVSDYCLRRGETDICFTLCKILSGYGNRCTISNIVKYELEDLINCLEHICDSDFGVTTDTLIFCIWENFRVKGIDLPSFMIHYDKFKKNKTLIIKILEEQYEKYKQITNVLLSNSVGQFTSTFEPTAFTLKQLYPEAKFDILKNHVRICFQAVIARRLPKYIIFKIFRDYFDSILIK